MSQYFDIINFDKKARLVLPQRAINLCNLYNDKDYDNAIVNMIAGDWRGDEIVVLGDYADSDRASELTKTTVTFLREKFKLSKYVQDWEEDMVIELGFEDGDFEHLEVEGDPSASEYRYAYNHKLKQYIDLTRYPRQGCYVSSPLVLLLAIGDGLSGRDYDGSAEEYVGSWAITSDSVSVERSLLDGDYTEIYPLFD